MLCRCFSDVPYKLFITGKEGDRVAFDKLVSSYSNARYNDGFLVSVENADCLYERVSALMTIARLM
jgi:hypothetical protein